eukprot:scaffold57841_cov58-Phaeocystis_antarctica.AAC.1
MAGDGMCMLLMLRRASGCSPFLSLLLFTSPLHFFFFALLPPPAAAGRLPPLAVLELLAFLANGSNLLAAAT